MSDRGDRAVVLAYGGVFALLSLIMAMWSRGFLEADGITHYLYAREAWSSPWIFTDVWGRPTVKVLHAIPAAVPGTWFGTPVGLLLVRATSLLLALAGAALAWRVASKMPAFYERPALGFVCALGSPLVFLHSFAVLTELPFGTLMVACLWAYAGRRWWLLALLAGLLPATRPEGIGFVLVVLVGLAMHRRWLELPLVLVGPLTWTLAGSWLSGDDGNPLTWLVRSWPYSGDSTYAAGPLFKFVGMLPAAVGPGLTPFVLIGLTTILLRSRGWMRDHETRIALSAAAVPMIVLVVHSLLHWTGKMASSGDVRYLLAVAPFWGALTALGFARVAGWIRMRAPELIAIVLGLIPWVALQIGYPVVPLEMVGDAVGAEDVADWWRSPASAELRETHPTLRVDHPVALYRLDMPPIAGGGLQLVRSAPPGTTFVWHEVYSLFNADDQKTVGPDEILAGDWNDATPANFPDGWRVFTSLRPEPVTTR